MVVTRVRPSIWMASCMTVWAIISGLTALSRNYTGLLLTRFFLGISEAPYYPGALYILARFYTRKELATRISILYTGNILATAFAGLIALGIFEMDGMVCCSNRSGFQLLMIPGQPRWMAMAFHNPRRSNSPRRHSRLLCLA
jgi:MFS family permease